ncbi:Hypothetical predicted protein [Pelobates cultripes]|uniref:ALMS motif domain-containing protein n=1 Tax=Pelobates cultripes TaxID=61616 RepID=A0AAD1WCL8_PELCU|nr:Hypothetical predicted protein [Pelobates cultripes]
MEEETPTNSPPGMESWYHLPAEEDVSGFLPPSCESVSPAEQTEFPTMEGGTLHSEKGTAHSIQLEMQDSVLSPCLPLLTSASTKGPRFFDETLYQQTEMEFAPLSGTLDMSEFPGQPSLQMSDAVALASKEVSLDLIGGSLAQPISALDDDASGMHGLTQHPLFESHTHSERSAEPGSQDVADADHPDLRNMKVGSTGDLDNVFSCGDGSFLDSSVPAPVLIELLEKEIGLSGSSQMSSRSSSSQTLSSKETENINMPQLQTQNFSEPYKLSETAKMTNISTVPEGESFKDSSEVDFFNAESFDDYERGSGEFNRSGPLNHSGITVRSTRQSSEIFKADLQNQLCSEIKQRYREKEILKISESLSMNEQNNILQTPFIHPESLTEPPQEETTVVEGPSSISRDELTISSHCSIERGHKDTEISPADSFPTGEASFMERLTNPISQSTPGTLTITNTRKQLTGRLMEIKAKLTESHMSLNEEPSNRSTTGYIDPCGAPQSAQSSQGYPASSDSQRSSSPPRRRIQSLPTLNYIEKVGAWNINQSFDALVLRGLTGISPKKKAYNAVADSLNRILSKQTSNSSPKRGLSASFAGPSSMTNLNIIEKEHSSSSHLARSQSYNSVITVGTESTTIKQTDAAIQPAKERDEIDRSIATQNSENLTKAGEIQSMDSLASSTEVDNDTVKHELQNLQENTLSGGHKHTVTSTSGARLSTRLDVDEEAHNIHPGSSNLTIGQFSDVSLDNDLTISSASHSSEPINQLSMDSATAASVHSLTSLEVDNFVPYWSPTQSIDKKEINIEERIPTYLRNLGIDQSPTTILTPFAPKGPIREPEFSPSEFRTIKGSTATPTKSMRLSEGGSQSAVNISQSSIYSTASTTSVSIPMGSDAEQESLFPTELSPSFSLKSAGDRPISQYDVSSHPATSSSQLPPIEKSNENASEIVSHEQEIHVVHTTQSVLPEVPPEPGEGCGSELKYVKTLIEQFESGDFFLNKGIHSLDENQFGVTSVPEFSEPRQAMDSTNDSFVGSKTLKEIRKLLSEADIVGLGQSGATFPPLIDVYGLSPTVRLNFDDSLKSDGLHNISTSSLDRLVKEMSWDGSLNSSMESDSSVLKGRANLNWDTSSISKDPGKHVSHLEEFVENHKQPAVPVAIQRDLGRSEPEGFNEEIEAVTVYGDQQTNEPSRDKGSPTALSREAGYNEELLNNVANAVGSLEQTLAKTGFEYLTGRQEVPESDDSSADSLAARVTSLLKSNAPLTQVVPGGEEDRRARSSLKLKLTSQPVLADTDLNEEDRRRIEEIKRELLEGAKSPAVHLEKNPCRTGYRDDHLGHWRDVNSFRLQITPSPNLSQSRDLRTTAQFLPAAIDGEFDSKGNIKRFKPASSEQSYLTQDLPQREEMDDFNSVPFKKGITNAFDTNITFLPPKTSEDSSKPITSITFASRKRFSPLLSSIGSESEYQEQFPKVAQSARSSETPLTDTHLRTETTDFKSMSKDKLNLNFAPNTPAVHLAQQIDILDTTPTFNSEEHQEISYAPSRHFLSPSAALDQGDDPGDNVKVRQSGRPTPVKYQLELEPSRHTISEEVYSRASVADQNFINIDSCPSSHPTFKYGEVNLDRTHQSSPDNCATIEPSTTSPGRKALSCIHVKISPKQDKPEKIESVPVVPVTVSVFANNGDCADKSEMSQNKVSPGFQDLAGHKGAESSATSYFLNSPTNTDGEGHTQESASRVTRKCILLSDATTQITTESPVKTTFSAEIFIDSSQKEEKPSVSHVRTRDTPEESSYYPQISHLSRATDQPLLLPYRPAGSPELFYVPYLEGASRVSPTSTVESSHPGSNDAVSPKFPAEVLGSISENTTEASIPKHKEGIYSKNKGPDTAWRQSTSAEFINGLKLPTKLHSPSVVAEKHTLQSDPEHHYGSFIERSVESLHQRGSRQYSRDRPDNLREKTGQSYYREDKEFFPLKPEFDDSMDNVTLIHKTDDERSQWEQTKTNSNYVSLHTTGVTRRNEQIQTDLNHKPTEIQKSNLHESHRKEKGTRNANTSFSRSLACDVHKRLQKNGSVLTQSTASTENLDDLWARFTDRRKSHLSESSNKLELSLVDRLDRLARLLQSSPSQSLVSEKDYRIQKGTRKENGVTLENKTRERVYQKKVAETQESSSVDETEIFAQQLRRTLHQRHYGDRFSEGSVSSDVTPEVRSSEVEISVQTDSEATTETAASGSISTIDTVRLIHAFGPERVRPSTRLSKLYDTINVQKQRTENRPRKAGRQSLATGKRNEFQKIPTKMTDSESSSSSCWETSSALTHKRSSKLLNKGIQAGDLEIVTSATRRNTRDVGTTFPSPGGEQQRIQTKKEPSWINGVLRPRERKSRAYVSKGLSWFVPAEDLKSDSRKENESCSHRGPSVNWYEPMTNARPWREPLREKHLQEQPVRRSGSLLNRSHNVTDTGDKSPSLFIKVTLQESLQTRRPDFIFRSGERVKRLQLLARERRLQTEFQEERDKLFNLAENRGGNNYTKSYNGSQITQRDRAILKKEMVKRSKRIYEQLPEVRKKKEDEKRKSEYETYRLKAQIFRKKVTNHILGRKTPWN